MWCGTIVHDVIEEVLAQKRRTRATILPLNKAENLAIQMLRRGYVESQNKTWEKNSKAVRLFEHHYDVPISKDQCDQLKAKAIRCINNFYKTPTCQWASETPVNDWLTLEEFQSFPLQNGGSVAVKIDFGILHDGKYKLLDWKSGKVSDDVGTQLLTYVMYAMKKMGAKMPNIVAIPVYLDSLDTAKEIIPIEISKDLIINYAELIVKELDMLKSAHAHGENIDKFPVTDNPNKCTRCPFQEICTKAKHEEVPEGVTPF
jgi:CRISPR/Cas system-associated exonuclease Cas4 (RecB family)